MKLPLLKILCLAIAAVNAQSAFALVALEDDVLSETTGEGVALLPENFAVSMNGPDAANGGAGTYGTGYMRFIPVGPLTATAIAKGYQKADGWLYGVSLAQSKKDYGVTIDGTDWGVPFGAFGTGATDFGRGITSWGTAENPWLIKTVTDNTVPNFFGTANQSVTYLGLEAPLYHSTQPATGTPASSAYNLKLGYWMDVAMRDAAVVESGYAGLSNRLRLAVAWNGFSVNGSNLKIFQTLSGVSAANSNVGSPYNATLKQTTNSNTTVNTAFTFNVTNPTYSINSGMSTSYNQTFGMAGLLRLNSQKTDAVRATVALGSITREIIQLDYYPVRNYNTVTQTRAGLYVEGAVLATNTVVSGVGTMAVATANATNSTAGIDETYVPMTDTSKRGPTVDPDAASLPANPHPLGTFPYKDSYPGNFLDGAVCTTSTSGNQGGADQFGQCLNNEGFTTRRFKVRSINSWTPPLAKSVLRISTQELVGGTFGVGTPALGGGADGTWGNVPDFRPNATAEGIFLYDMNVNMVLGNLYQPLMLSTDGNNFSVELARIPNNVNVYNKIYTRYESIDPQATVDPSVTYQGSTCNVHQCGTAVTLDGVGYQGSTATHSSITIGSTVYDATTNKLSAAKGADAYGISFGESLSEAGLNTQVSTDYVQVWNRTRTDSGGGWSAYGAWGAVAAKTALPPQPHPSLERPTPYETTYNQNYNNRVLGIHTTMPVSNMAGTINNLTPLGASALNNFGSVAIDGLLIQHLKFSTTGL